MRTIAITNQKGGCGKTITAINLSAFLARARKRVLLVDLDPQGHATLGLLKNAGGLSRSMADVLRRPAAATLGDVIQPVSDRLDVAPADIRLSGVQDGLAGVDRREWILAEAFEDVRGRYDVAVVDCPPHVGLLTFNALHACTEAIVPMDPSFFSLHGLGKQLETFDLVARHSGHTITPRVLITLYAGRSPFVKAVLDEIHTHLPGRHYRTTIRYSTKLAEAASHALPIADYSRHSAGFADYAALAAEVLEQDAGATDDLAPGVSFAAAAPLVTPDGVVFTLEAPEAAHVQLVADFNQWVIEGNEMERAGGYWTKRVKLEPGRYRYRFVVDGRWQSDPLNSTTEPCPFGGVDSVVVLEAAAGQPAARH
jgi:chromosome partitioning protein